MNNLQQITLVCVVSLVSSQVCLSQTLPAPQQLTIRTNAFGLGINSDQYGRPQRYVTQQNKPLAPINQGNVKRDAYGLGVHADPSGQPVKDSLP